MFFTCMCAPIPLRRVSPCRFYAPLFETTARRPAAINRTRAPRQATIALRRRLLRWNRYVYRFSRKYVRDRRQAPQLFKLPDCVLWSGAQKVLQTPCFRKALLWCPLMEETPRFVLPTRKATMSRGVCSYCCCISELGLVQISLFC